MPKANLGLASLIGVPGSQPTSAPSYRGAQSQPKNSTAEELESFKKLKSVIKHSKKTKSAGGMNKGDMYAICKTFHRDIPAIAKVSRRSLSLMLRKLLASDLTTRSAVIAMLPRCIVVKATTQAIDLRQWIHSGLIEASKENFGMINNRYYPRSCKLTLFGGDHEDDGYFEDWENPSQLELDKRIVIDGYEIGSEMQFHDGGGTVYRAGDGCFITFREFIKFVEMHEHHSRYYDKAHPNYEFPHRYVVMHNINMVFSEGKFHFDWDS